jgi:2-C-methyl-D-erythritol 4-phosphate cytidylyltransferase
MSKFAVIVAAAGRSSRFGGSSTREKKVFQEIKGRAVWLRSVEAFINRDDVAQTIVVVSPEDIDWFKEKYAANLAFLTFDLVEGGAERADSVLNALAKVNSDIEFVAVHDAARPLITKQSIDDVFKAAKESGAAILTTPVSSTLKRVDSNTIADTVPRDGLHEAQTPQVFGKELLVDAYAQRGELTATDESFLVEQAGHAVTAVPGSPLNIKVTTRGDLRTAEALLAVLPRGQALDALNPLADDGPKWLFS